MQNRFPGNCHRCHTRHEANAALLVKIDGRWAVQCPPTTVCEIRRAPAPAARPTATVGDMAGVLALFGKAAKHLKFPAIVLSVPALGDGVAIRLNIAGPKAKQPGTITVVDGNKDGAGERAWLGRILLDGTYQPSNHAIDSLSVPALAARLVDFSQHPAEVAAEHGKLTGRCCFCNLRLTDERSTAVGYGPICADHFGLAWGARPAEFAEPAIRKHRAA